MKKLVTVLIAASMILSGCQESRQKSSAVGPPTDGIKIGDLKPVGGESTAPQLLLALVVFEVPSEQTENLQKLYSMTEPQKIDFTDYAVFKKNSSFAGVAPVSVWNRIYPALMKLNARQLDTMQMIFFEGYPQYVPIRILDSEYAAFYVGPDDKLLSLNIPPGRLSWCLEIKNPSPPAGSVQLNIKPCIEPFGETVLGIWAQNTFREHYGRLFDFASISAPITEGNYLILGPTRFDPDFHSMTNILFNVWKEPQSVLVLVFFCLGVGD